MCTYIFTVAAMTSVLTAESEGAPGTGPLCGGPVHLCG